MIIMTVYNKKIELILKTGLCSFIKNSFIHDVHYDENLTTMGIIDEELNNDNIKYQMDKTDFRIVSLLVLGYGSNKITSTLKIL